MILVFFTASFKPVRLNSLLEMLGNVFPYTLPASLPHHLALHIGDGFHLDSHSL